MTNQTDRPLFSFAHMGVNMPSEEASAALAEQFLTAFGFAVKTGASSNFAGAEIEIMKRPYLGKNGHIAIGTPDMEAAMEYLTGLGYTFDKETAKYKDGEMIAIYLEQDFGGFAVHLLRKG